jgi:PAS domain S-box-containing protein
MRIGEKLKYQQLVDYIKFPVVIYIYETRRIIAINKKAKDILVPDDKILRYMPDVKFRTQIANQILNEEPDILLDMPIVVGIREIRIDLEVNSIELDHKHLVIMLFDYTENQSFGDRFFKHVPRFFWKDKKLKLKGVSYFCLQDIQEHNVKLEDIDFEYDKEIQKLVLEDDTKVVQTKEPVWNVVQLVQYKSVNGTFINMQRVPIINKNGTVIGILGSYNIVLSKKEMDEELTWLKYEKSKLTKLLESNDSIFLRVRMDEDWSVEYITSNIRKLGYTCKDFYLKKNTFRSIILEEDLKRVVRDFLSSMKEGTERIEMEYRIKKSDGTPIWVKGTSVYIDSENNTEEKKYVDFILRDITGIKTLQKELEISKDAMNAKIEIIKKGEIPIKSVRFTDLFKMEDLLSSIQSFAAMMNISCTITDYVGRTLCDIIRQPYIADEVYQYYEKHEGREIFRNLYRQIRNGEENYLYDKVNGLYVYAIPFKIEDKFIGLLDILTKEEILSDSPMMVFLSDMVEKLCNSVQKDIELIREADRRENAEEQLRLAQRKGDFLNKELEIAVADNNLHNALNRIIYNLTQFIYVGEVILFRQTNECKYTKQLEWNNKGEQKHRTTQVYEQLNLGECEELMTIFKHANIVIYQQGEVPESLYRQFRFRRVKSLVMIMFEFESGKNFILAFCDRNAKSDWTHEKILLLTDVSNIIKAILQRTIEN